MAAARALEAGPILTWAKRGSVYNTYYIIRIKIIIDSNANEILVIPCINDMHML